MKRPTIHFLGIDLSLIMFMFLTMTSCLQIEPKRRPVRYLIPDGYVGWVKADFGIQNAPALPIEDSYSLARFPESGELKTSSNIEYGWAKDDYYYYSDDTRRALRQTTWGGGGLIWGGFNGEELNSNNEVVQRYLQFFVGTEDEYKNHMGSAGIKQPGRIAR